VTGRAYAENMAVLVDTVAAIRLIGAALRHPRTTHLVVTDAEGNKTITPAPDETTTQATAGAE
jgi:hypothetical protein